MKNTIIKLLKEQKEMSAYSLVCFKVESKEAFFIKDKLDMNRGKNVVKTSLTVYKDFEADGKKYRGSASCKISSQDSEEVLKEKISEALFASSFVKNKWYPLPKPSNDNNVEVESIKTDLMECLLKMQKTVYSLKEEGASINSSEFFSNKVDVEIINSEGVDVSYTKASNEAEVITEAKGDEEVELYGYIEQGAVSEDSLAEILAEQLKNTRERAIAKKATPVDSINVILKDSCLPKFFMFYTQQCSASEVYSKKSRAKIGESLQGEIKGDAINIMLDPERKTSPFSSPYDASGLRLKKVPIMEDGVVKTFHGDTRFAHYLGIEPTGNIQNIDVGAGTLSYDNDMKAKPYFEILMFSDFFMDVTTGNFGGEFRLARYFDGKETHIVTGGSISGNMFKVQGDMYLSKEIIEKGAYRGPKAVLLPNMQIVG